MTDDLKKLYLGELDFTGMTKDEIDLFFGFVKRYFNELVKIGYLLKDVDFKNLSNDGRRKIVHSALRLWKNVNHS